MARSRNGTATIVDGENGTETAKTPSDKHTVSFQLPLDAYAVIEGAAKAANTNVAAFARGIFAREFGLVLPAVVRGGRKNKYASKEDRIAAQAAKQKSNRDKMKALLALYDQNPQQIAEMLAAAGIDATALTADATA